MIWKPWTRIDGDSGQVDQAMTNRANHSKQQETIMGEAKRRKEQLGDKYGQEKSTFPWLSITKTQTEQFMKWTTRGSWIGIGLVAASWIIIRFVGPSLGWWHNVN
jgi:hypothetical protein